MDEPQAFNFSIFTKLLYFSLSKNYFETAVDFRKIKKKAKWGVVPFRILESGEVEVLVVSTRRKNWSLPKGNLIKTIGPARTAQLEAYEEAGIDGNLQPKPICCSIGNACIYFYPMEVTKVYDEWPESNFRKRKWIQLSRARNLLHHREMGKLLRKFFPLKA